jgi:hypothetical protein
MFQIKDLNVVVTVNKNDLWFCRLCISSILYYYPDIEIYLLKDELNGTFSTVEIEKYWNVKIINLGPTKFGWSAAKIFLYTDVRFRGKYFFVIDSDIIFVGKLLDVFLSKIPDFDLIVSPEFEKNPYANWVKDIYFDVKKIENINSDYNYPGYFFNAGQLLLKGGFLTKNDLKDYFDFERFPFWKKLDILPLVDQSLLNYLIPILQNQNSIKVCTDFNFMIWSRSDTAKNITLKFIKNNTDFPHLIHWAGDIRTNFLVKMNCPEVLIYFEDAYYAKLPFGKIKKNVRKIIPVLNWYLSISKKIVKKHLLNK